MRKYTMINCETCGKEMSVRDDYLKKHSGKCMSCQKKGNQHAKKHGCCDTRLYRIWTGMFNRRYRINPKVCMEWHEFNNFKEWALDNGYQSSLTIDRIDNNGNYNSKNCQWISLQENSGKDKVLFNREQKIYHFNNRKKLKKTQRDYAKDIGVSRNTIQRLEKEIKESI